MEMLKFGRVEIGRISRIFPLLEEMEEGEISSLVYGTCVDSYIIDAYWVRRDAEQEDASQQSTQMAISLAALLDEDPVYAGWRDLEYLEVRWDGNATPQAAS